MPACIFISSRTPWVAAALFFALAAVPQALAQDGGPKQDTQKTLIPEEEDFSGTPFTEYGEFNEQSDEEEDTKFLQYGRLFGVSLGLGYQIVDGNRGALWEGGFPVVDFKVLYWFDFNFSIDLGFGTALHRYFANSGGLGNVDVTMFKLFLDVKYSIDTHNLAAPLSFASPFLLIGTGSIAKTEISQTKGTTETDASIGLFLGAGLEFVLKPKKLYIQLEGKALISVFKDTYTSKFSTGDGLADLTGNFYTITGNVVFTW